MSAGKNFSGFKNETPRYWLRLEQTFVLVSLLVFFHAFIRIIFSHAIPGAGNRIDQITVNHLGLLCIYIAIYCIATLLIIRQWREILELAIREKFILMLLTLAGVSALWSAAPQITLASWVALSGSTIFGVYFALRFKPAEQLQLLAWTSIIAIFSCFVAAVVFPDTGIMMGTHDGLWRGVFIHKNIMAITIPLASISLFILAARDSRRQNWYWFCFFMALVLLTLSGSKASLLNYIFLFLGISAYLALCGQRKLCLLALLSVVLAGSSLAGQVKYGVFPAAIYSEIRETVSATSSDKQKSNDNSGWTGVSAFLSRVQSAAPDSSNPAHFASATGRVPLWKALWTRHQERPLLGYGVGGFWLGTVGPSKHIWQEFSWKPRKAHNGFIELVLSLGLAGLALFLFSFVQTGFRAYKRLRMTPFDPVRLYIPALLVYILLANAGESALFAPNLFVWVCYVAAATSLAFKDHLD